MNYDGDLPTGDFGMTDSYGCVPAQLVDEMAMGIDLGQAYDSTAITVIRKVRKLIPVVAGDASTVGTDLRRKLEPEKFYVEYATRLPLGMSYVEQSAIIQGLTKDPKYKRATVVVDRSGVGRSCVDTLSDIFNVKLIRVSITSGRNPGKDKDGITVPKIDLLSALFAAFQKKAIHLHPGLKDYKEIMRQFQNLHAMNTPGGSLTFNAAGGNHDDYCIAAALALYRLAPPTSGRKWKAIDLSTIIS